MKPFDSSVGTFLGSIDFFLLIFYFIFFLDYPFHRRMLRELI